MMAMKMFNRWTRALLSNKFKLLTFDLCYVDKNQFKYKNLHFLYSLRIEFFCINEIRYVYSAPHTNISGAVRVFCISESYMCTLCITHM